MRGLAFTYRRFPLSRISYTLIFIFLCLHTLGAHYTYAEVPYDDWFRALTGRTFNEVVGWQRNNFDRVVHFCYGLLLAYPIRELFLRIAGVRGFWGYFLPLDLTMSTSMLYELVEWAGGRSLRWRTGAAYLGTQGDVWDAHKDMALASLGALIAMSVTAWINCEDQARLCLRVAAQPASEEHRAARRGGARRSDSRTPIGRNEDRFQWPIFE